MVVGIDLEGRRDVGIWIGENESAKFWLTVLNELKSRGAEEILIACVDNLKGFSEACYPKTDIQKCMVHQIRNPLKYFSYKDYKAVTAALKPIYKASTEEAALEELDRFEQVWGAKYPIVVRLWRTVRARKLASGKQLTLQRLVKGLHHNVLIGISQPGHADHATVTLHHLLIAPTGILSPSVRMDIESRPATAEKRR